MQRCLRRPARTTLVAIMAPHAMYFSTIVLVEAGSSGMWRLRQVAAQALEK